MSALVGIDETIECRRCAKIEVYGVYRDPVRSSKEHFVNMRPRVLGMRGRLTTTRHRHHAFAAGCCSV
jgi:hypothetical protein